MITIYEAISPLGLGISIILSMLMLWLLRQIDFIRSYFDPSILILFQLTYTFFALATTGLLNVQIVICYLLLFITVITFRNVTLFEEVLITEEQWVLFTKLFLVISVVMNIILIYKKGFILLHPNPSEAKLYFYQGAGIFKRINDIGQPLFGVSVIYLFYRKQKVYGTILLIYTFFLLLTSGSKSGFISLALSLGAYVHFYKVPLNKGVIASLLAVGIISMLGMFYWTYRERAIDNFYRRTVAFADGPFYFYKGNLQSEIKYPVDYVLDQLLVNTRVKKELTYKGLGAAINEQYFGAYNLLEGPNPQFIVEGPVVFGWLFFLYPVIGGFLFAVLRKTASTPFSFILMGLFFNPLLLDAQYAFSNLLTLSLTLPLLMLVKFMASIRKKNLVLNV